jgi:hypothetical protein
MDAKTVNMGDFKGIKVFQELAGNWIRTAPVYQHFTGHV